MKNRTLILAAFVLFALPFVTSAQGNYAATPDEEMYGTWINEKAIPQKTVSFAGGYRDYSLVGNEVPSAEGDEQIMAKWSDEDGNIWYKIVAVPRSGYYAKMKFQLLICISRNGTARELVGRRIYGDFDPHGPPLAIDPNDKSYRIYYRAPD